jgi:hypothetical protein
MGVCDFFFVGSQLKHTLAKRKDDMIDREREKNVFFLNVFFLI